MAEGRASSRRTAQPLRRRRRERGPSVSLTVCRSTSWSGRCCRDAHAGVTHEALLVAARAELRPGLTRMQAVIVGYSGLVGARLDPCGFDDSALILRAERLLEEGLSVVDAVEAATREGVTWGFIR